MSNGNTTGRTAARILVLTCLLLSQLSEGFSIPGSIQSPRTPKQRSSPTTSLFDKSQPSNDADEKPKDIKRQLSRSFFISSSLALLTNLGLAYAAPPNFQRIPTQFIAALGDPVSSSGANVKDWGLWTVDPGPRGVYLKDYQGQLASRNNVSPSGWAFDDQDWWLEEHGLIMEAPIFPISDGRYLVTGGRLVTTVLTVQGGAWSLEKGKLGDVTHLPCRSARYKPVGGMDGGGPLTANQREFPVKPGAEMPKVKGCEKQDYAVLFVIGKEVVS